MQKKKELIDIMRLPQLITHGISCFVPELRKTAEVSASFKMIQWLCKWFV